MSRIRWQQVRQLFERLTAGAFTLGHMIGPAHAVRYRIAQERGKPLDDDLLPGRALQKLLRSEEDRELIKELTADMTQDRQR